MRAVVAALLLLVGLASPAAAETGSSALDQVSVTNDRSTVDTKIGQRFSFTTTVTNDGDQPVTGLVAHLNVLSVDPGTYVDPEDWSSDRTLYLDPVPAHSSAKLSWRVQVVNDGQFVIYVAVTTRSGPGPVVASDGVRLSASPERTVNAGGVLPVAVGIPCALLLLMLLNAARRRRLR
jgi:uncharacterized repeat protein (TIGR01451 family)